MSQKLPIWENYLVMFVCLGIYSRIYFGICHEICLEICHAEKKLKKHGLPKFTSSPPLGGRPHENSGRPWNLIHSPPCRNPCGLFIHEVFFGPLGLHLHVWSELGRFLPFRPIRALRLQWSWAFNLVCEVALSHVDMTKCGEMILDLKWSWYIVVRSSARKVFGHSRSRTWWF